MRQIRVQRRRASRPAEVSPQQHTPTEPLADTTSADALLARIDEALQTP